MTRELFSDIKMKKLVIDPGCDPSFNKSLLKLCLPRYKILQIIYPSNSTSLGQDKFVIIDK